MNGIVLIPLTIKKEMDSIGKIEKTGNDRAAGIWLRFLSIMGVYQQCLGGSGILSVTIKREKVGK